jgi:two-component system chemotaxis response regulator CheB
MILFCEECGEQCTVDTKCSGGEQRIRCHHCDETLIVTPNPDIQKKTTQAAVALTPPTEKEPANKTLKVLIVDDSKFIRRSIKDLFATDPQLEVIGEAANGKEALEKIAQLNPDVVTLDINMPEMDGIATIKHIMIKSPRPTLMFSTMTSEGATETFDALRYGAVDFLQKPSQSSSKALEIQKKEIIRKIKIASAVKLDNLRFLRCKKNKKENNPQQSQSFKNVFAVGTAEGGYAALLKVIPQLEQELVAVLLVVLYAENRHVDAFVNYLDKISAIRVKRAKDGDLIEGGTCYLASEEEYMTLKKEDDNYRLSVHGIPFPERKGTINMLMFSVAETFGRDAGGIILTGCGQDGIEGMGEIVRSGGITLVQDPENCLCKEMARRVLEQYAIDKVVSDQTLAAEINFLCQQKLNACA